MDDCDAGLDDPNHGLGLDPARQAIGMLMAVLDGCTYDQAGAAFGITRTGVERRVKRLAGRLMAEVGVDGLTPHALTSVRRLRKSRSALEDALARFEPAAVPASSDVVSSEALASAVRRVRARSAREETSLRDVAMLLVIFSTGGRPQEIARLQVRDYVDADGTVRRRSRWRPEISYSGRARPLFFASATVTDAVDEYLAERMDRSPGGMAGHPYRGFDPQAMLFLDASGMPFSSRARSRPGLESRVGEQVERVFERILRQSELGGVTPLSVQQTLAARLYSRGADEAQIGEVLGIRELRVIRRRFPRRRPSLEELMDNVI